MTDSFDIRNSAFGICPVPPNGNANFAWVQHFIHHLAPQGMTGFVLANGSMSSNQSGEGDIRRALIEADLVDCMVALPGQLFHSTQTPANFASFKNSTPIEILNCNNFGLTEDSPTKLN